MMHHPSRAESRSRIESEISVDYVHTDYKERGPWPTARACWKRGIQSGADWILVIQDDIETCKNFDIHLERIADTQPVKCINFYCISTAKRKKVANKSSTPWIRIAYSTLAPAMMLPTHWARSLIEFCGKYVPVSYPHDDTRVTWWLQENRNPCWVTVPSLVRHRNEMNSILGHAGSRRALLYESKPGKIDWSNTKDTPKISGSPIDSRYDYTSFEK
jgi:hypothetical protein